MHNKAITGKLFDIKGFSVHDGPGIRITLFLKGCPLRCPWCHSPESQAFHTELNWLRKKCAGIEKCGRCLGACPNGAIAPAGAAPAAAAQTAAAPAAAAQTAAAPAAAAQTAAAPAAAAPNGAGAPGAGAPRDSTVTVDRTKCDNCGSCAKACTTGALFMCGADYTADAIMGRIRRDVPFFNRTGGGVTISGGECLCQPEFTLEILKRCKGESIHTAVDTSGFAEWGAIEPILPYTDLFLYDIKGADETLHERVVGAPNGIILENARKIAGAGGKLQIRIPIIPGYNDTEEAFDGMGRFVKELGSAAEAVSLLPYHNLGTAKWERLARGGPAFEAKAPSDELIGARKKQLEDMGLVVVF